MFPHLVNVEEVILVMNPLYYPDLRVEVERYLGRLGLKIVDKAAVRLSEEQARDLLEYRYAEDVQERLVRAL